MKQFNDKNFVLETEVAQDLYHNHAAKMPIIDYHCHLIPEIYNILKKGTEAAREVGAQTMSEVRKAMQIDYFG